jgi:hypothetical protein
MVRVAFVASCIAFAGASLVSADRGLNAGRTYFGAASVLADRFVQPFPSSRAAEAAEAAALRSASGPIRSHPVHMQNGPPIIDCFQPKSFFGK